MSAVRANWERGLEGFYQQNPDLEDLDWESILEDNDIFASIMHDVIKMRAEVPHKSGPRPKPDRKTAQKLMDELLEACD